MYFPQAIIPNGSMNWLNLTNKNDDYIKYFGNYQDLDMYDNVATNDWQDLTFGRTGHSFNHNLSINGGSDKFKYSFSYSHIDDKAIMQMSDYARDNLNLKLNHKPLKNVSLDFQHAFPKPKSMVEVPMMPTVH